MLIPKIQVSRIGKNDCLNVIDVTGIYSADNLGGWNSPNVERASITSATLYLLKDGKQIKTVSVLSAVSSAVTDDIDFGCVFNGYINKDGTCQVRYMITDASGEIYYDNRSVVYINDYIERQINKMWVLLAQMTDVYNRKDFEQECIWLDTNYNGLMSLCRTKNTASYNNLYGIIIKRLEYIKNKYM